MKWDDTQEAQSAGEPLSGQSAPLWMQGGEAAPTTLTLEQFCGQIKRRVELPPLRAWVVATVKDVNVNKGHYYVTLIDVDSSGSATACLDCHVWSGNVSRVIEPFETATGIQLSGDLKIRVLLHVEYHKYFGLSAQLDVLDANYTCGQLALMRAAAIARLRADGSMEINKSLELPLVPQRVAIVSSATAAGYEDFVRQLTDNAAGYTFRTALFAATVQGERASGEIIAALDAINARREEFDVVVIIRGGGSQLDMSCFDNEDLARNIGQFPLPVLTGIGHTRDESIADMVAYQSLKTPTAVAAFLVGCVDEYARHLDELGRWLMELAARQLGQVGLWLARVEAQVRSGVWVRQEAETQRRIAYLDQMCQRILSGALNQCERRMLECDRVGDRLMSRACLGVQARLSALEAMRQKVEARDPRAVLRRGFTLTSLNGHALSSPSGLEEGSVIVTRFATGQVESVVKG